MLKAALTTLRLPRLRCFVPRGGGSEPRIVENISMERGGGKDTGEERCLYSDLFRRTGPKG